MTVSSSEKSSTIKERAQADACTVCAELQALPTSLISRLGEARDIRNVVIGCTDELSLIPSVGALTPNHMLIVSRKHQYRILGIECLREQTENLLNVAFDKFCGQGRVILAFEHGSRFPLPEKRSCTTLHAHVQVIPLDRAAANRVLLRGPYPVGVEASPWDLVKDFSNEFVCSFLWDRSGKYSAVGGTDEILPSQLLRRLVANELGLSEWDWRKMLEPRDLTFPQHSDFNRYLFRS